MKEWFDTITIIQKQTHLEEKFANVGRAVVIDVYKLPKLPEWQAALIAKQSDSVRTAVRLTCYSQAYGM